MWTGFVSVSLSECRDITLKEATAVTYKLFLIMLPFFSTPAAGTMSENNVIKISVIIIF
jgi:hypothetical protein